MLTDSLTDILCMCLSINACLKYESTCIAHNSPSNSTNTNATTAGIWTPAAGTTWQIILSEALKIDKTNPSLTPDVAVIDFDLFDNTNDGSDKSVIDALHSIGKKVICYFSAGSYEPGRPDSNQFKPSDKGDELDGWPGEYWLNLNSPNVARIMKDRVQLAASVGCDAIDPDNMDAYDNKNGLGMTQQDSINFLNNVLSPAAKEHHLAMGLKNAGDIIPHVMKNVQFSVNEQCSQYDECSVFAPFISANKPVFHIEYPKGAGKKTPVSNKDKWCVKDGDGQDITKFSTNIKTMDLDGWVELCDGKIYNTPTLDS